MPLTAFQKRVARILAKQRNPESHLAGGAVINRADSSPRYSNDLDIFHDPAANVAAFAEADAQALQEAGCSVQWNLRGAGMYRAEVSEGEERVRLDWTTDSPFRFFPAQPDEEFGYCLHPADLATNKVLALAGRDEIRDFLDVLLIDRAYLSLGAVIWAACGKDAGFTPVFLLDQTNRHARFQESQLRTENLARPVDLQELKKHWLAAQERAKQLFERLPAAELGCLYLNFENNPVTPDPDSPDFAKLQRHFGSVGGAWPK
jgi:hypothetical protein